MLIAEYCMNAGLLRTRLRPHPEAREAPSIGDYQKCQKPVNFCLLRVPSDDDSFELFSPLQA